MTAIAPLLQCPIIILIPYDNTLSSVSHPSGGLVFAVQHRRHLSFPRESNTGRVCPSCHLIFVSLLSEGEAFRGWERSILKELSGSYVRRYSASDCEGEIAYTCKLGQESGVIEADIDSSLIYAGRAGGFAYTECYPLVCQ